MEDIKKGSWASAKEHPDFICVETCSGYRATTTDPEGKRHLLLPNSSNHVLGEAILDALAHSRFVPPLEQPELDIALFDFELSRMRYSKWVSDLMETYGYKNQRELFKEMKNCNLEMSEGMIEIRPNHHEKLEAWSGKGSAKIVT